ncbi:hypothetical protein BVRB_5g125720 [Beta vulgaris subsp. vulgaris]|uniref:Uncharacterized protein n=1 Tax=Beta vulgaris subsp. vulgaris TaxID=3555 RepID=A0A0J8BC33_BETVV|nr:hypothetical protein BVRB_5g125720 [Beta vulgaris subsp. vulgaris]
MIFSTSAFLSMVRRMAVAALIPCKVLDVEDGVGGRNDGFVSDCGEAERALLRRPRKEDLYSGDAQGTVIFHGAFTYRVRDFSHDFARLLMTSFAVDGVVLLVVRENSVGVDGRR